MRTNLKLLTLALSVAWWVPHTADAQDVVKIGFHAPLTGFAAADSKSARQGAELAVRQANAAGGINGKAIRDTVRANSFDTAIGRLSFNALGEVKKAVQVQVIKDANFHHYAVIDDLQLLAPPEK